MKKNILALLIASTFMVACNDSNKDSSQSSKSIQAFDGPVQFADAVADCGAGKIELGQTDYDGIVSSTSSAINNTPELCEIIITGNAYSIDTSNSKAMPNINYVIPRGLLAAGAPITASPLTTLIAEQIEADLLAGLPRDISDVVTQVVNDLYGVTFVEDLANNAGVTPLDLARDMEGTIEKLEKLGIPRANVPLVSYVSLITATNHVANDVIVYAQDKSLNIKSVIATIKAVGEKLVADKHDYPKHIDGDIYVTVPPKAVQAIYDNVKNNVVNPLAGVDNVIVISPAEHAPKPATGATGGS